MGDANTLSFRESGSLVDVLREDILSLAIPPGSDLEEKQLAEKYQVSRTPIREALIRLAAEGLVEFKPRRGARVIPIILPNLPRYLEAFSLVHRALARLSAARSLKRDLNKIEAAIVGFRTTVGQIDIFDYQTVMAATSAENAAFHAIAEGAHNVYLLEIFEKLRMQGQRMLRLAFAYQPRGQIDVASFAARRALELEALGAAIAKSDGEGAEAHSKILHDGMVERLMAYLAENLTEEIEIQDAVPGTAAT